MGKILLSTTPTLKPNYLIKRQPFLLYGLLVAVSKTTFLRESWIFQMLTIAPVRVCRATHLPTTVLLQPCSRHIAVHGTNHAPATGQAIQGALGFASKTHSCLHLHPGRTPDPLRTVKVRLRCPCPAPGFRVFLRVFVLGNRFSLDSLFRVSVLGKRFLLISLLRVFVLGNRFSLDSLFRVSVLGKRFVEARH